ncbi:MAG: tetratricopeptide repeat protein [Thermodesulfobacteriota bacterium]
MSPVLGANFVWDDGINIVDNPKLAPVTAKNIATVWKEPFIQLYIPLTYTVWSGVAVLASSFDPETRRYIFDPLWFHGLNLILHLLCTLLVYNLAGHLVRRGPPAFLAALFFGIFPTQVEAVAWATELKTLLCAVLVLAAANRQILYLEARAKGRQGFRPFSDYLLGLLLFIAALLAKPLAVVAPLILFFAGHFFLRVRLKDNLWAVAPWLAATVPMVFITMLAQPVGGFQTVLPLFKRIFIAGDTAAFYIGHVLFPARIGIDYGRTPDAVFSSPLAYVAWLLPAGLLALAFAFRRRYPGYLGALLIFLVGFFPVSGIVPFVFQRISTVADRYLYFSMLGPALGVALFFSQKKKAWIRAAFLCALGFYGVLCLFQARTWEDENSLYFHALLVNENSSMSLFNLAQAGSLVDKARIDKIRVALLKDARDPKMSRELAKILMIYIEGETDSILNEFRNPDQLTGAKQMVSLGVRLLDVGQISTAVSALGTAFALRPDLTAAHVDLAAALLKSGRFEDALALGELATQVAPEDPDAANNHAAALFCIGNRKKALQIWEKATERNPENRMLARNLALARRLASFGTGSMNPFTVSVKNPPEDDTGSRPKGSG